MNSDPPDSQPTQLLQHALALPAQQNQEHSTDCDLASLNDGGDAADDFSMDSRIMPVRPVTPRYHLQVSLLQSPGAGCEHMLAGDFQQETRQENGGQARTFVASPSDNVVSQGSRSDPFRQHGDSSLSACAGKVIGTSSKSFHCSPTTTTVLPLFRPTKSMPVENHHRHRSPSFPSQDSFGGPISQDPGERYVASTKQFNVPLSDLGETPTQEVIHSPTDPNMTLPDASEHREFLEAAMRKYEAQRANRATFSPRPNILVAATPSNSVESSQASLHRSGDFSFHNHNSERVGQESRFEFGGSSSFDKMLDRDLADVSDPTPDPTQPKGIESTQVDDIVDVKPSISDDIFTSLPQDSKECSLPFDWIAPAPMSAVASSNPRSLLRMVHPDNRYRIAKMRNLAGGVEPPSCVTAGVETQPSGMEETQPRHMVESTHLNALPASRKTKAAGSRPYRYQPQREDDDEELEDVLDIVPDSEPLRADSEPLRVESSAQTSSHHLPVTGSPLEKRFRPLSPVMHGSGDLAPNSLEVEQSEADIPLAVEVAVRSTISRAPTEDIPLHGRKTRTASSAVPDKPQKHASSMTKGRNFGVETSRTELTEIPTSLPEQDLQGEGISSREPLAAPSKILSSKRRGPQPLESSRVPHTSKASLPAAKPMAGRKRFHKSDTENSEDLSRHPTKSEEVTLPKVRKEEEEEIKSVGDRDTDSPPPPPSKPSTSRKRKRRAEDVNATRGGSRASASTRSKRSETPAVATRSVKRPRSGLSSTRGFTAEPATPVFALWKQDGYYYSGIVHSRRSKNKHLVKFDDGTEDEVELKNMRRRELLVGDRVIIIQDSVKGVVSDVSHADSYGSFRLDIDNGEAVATVQVGFGDIRIANRTIQNQWKERTVLAEHVVTAVKLKPTIDATPSKESVTSTTSGKAQREFVKTGFVVTINPKNEDLIQTKDDAMRAIRQHGGLVIEDWSSVFTMEGRHSQSNKRWIATPQDFRWRPEVNLDRVFLLSDDAHQKPKFLLALALGIPCLSFEWLTREGKFSSDWQLFLLPAGYSDTLGARLSQLVDLDWGNCAEHLTDIMANQVPIKLFLQKTVLCVGADLVPLPSNRARKGAPEEASRYVPWIILCMGAAKVEAVTDTKQVSAAYLRTFDYIIVKERNLLGSAKLGKDVVVGDVNWVKECLVSSRLSTPELD